MEHAEKFALIPEEFLSKHIPSLEQMSEFDLAMSKVLNSSLSDHEKVHKYYDLLKRKMNLEEYNLPWRPPSKEEKSSKKEESSINELPELDKKEEQSENNYTDIILNAVPHNMKRQANNLLHILKSHPKTIRWSDKGEVTYKNQTLSQSNIADLFNLIFTRHKLENIIAKDEFLQALDELNVPKHFIKNKQLSNVSKKQESSTPVKKRKRSNYKWDSYKD